MKKPIKAEDVLRDQLHKVKDRVGDVVYFNHDFREVLASELRAKCEKQVKDLAEHLTPEELHVVCRIHASEVEAHYKKTHAEEIKAKEAACQAEGPAPKSQMAHSSSASVSGEAPSAPTPSEPTSAPVDAKPVGA